MKIKIVGRTEMYLAPEGCEETVYDIYYGITGIPATWPFHTKWKIMAAGLSEEEMYSWVKSNYLSRYTNIIIKV